MIAEFLFFAILGLIGWAIAQVRKVTKRRINEMEDKPTKQSWDRRDWN